MPVRDRYSWDKARGSIKRMGYWRAQGVAEGESYLTASTLHEIERIKLHRRSLAKPRNVPVASFA